MEMEGVANGDVMCVAMKTGVSVPHLVSNHPLICTRPSAWHCTLSVRIYRFSQKARYIDGQTWVRPIADVSELTNGSIFIGRSMTCL